MSQIKVGDKVREKADAAVKNDVTLYFLTLLAGHDWNEVPDQLEGTVVAVERNKDDDEVLRVSYSNAPEWAPEDSRYYENDLELV